MSSVHDNGSVGEQSQPDPSATDLRDLIDRAGAVAAALEALVQEVDCTAYNDDVCSMPAFNGLLNAANDVHEARWYARRALHSLRALL